MRHPAARRGVRWSTLGFFGVAVVVAAGCSDFAGVEQAQSIEAAFEAQVSRMRALGDGCALLARDRQGTLRGIAIPRRAMPFNVPAPKNDRAKKRASNRFVIMQIARPDGTPAFLGCFVPDETSDAKLAAAIAKSHPSGRAWKRLLRGVDHAKAVPPREQRVLGPAALRFQSELGLGADSSTQAFGGPAFECEGPMTYQMPGAPTTARTCVCSSTTVSFNFWFIHLEVTFTTCDEDGGGSGSGSTPTNNDYFWLLENDYAQGWELGSAGDDGEGGGGGAGVTPSYEESCDPLLEDCYQLLDADDSTAIAAGISRMRPAAGLPDSVAQMCQQMSSRYDYLNTRGWVFKGNPAISDGAQGHYGMAQQSGIDGTWKIHIDGDILDHATDPNDLNQQFYQDFAGRVALHEAAHTLGYTHGNRLSDGGYNEWPFTHIDGTVALRSCIP